MDYRRLLRWLFEGAVTVWYSADILMRLNLRDLILRQQ